MAASRLLAMHLVLNCDLGSRSRSAKMMIVELDHGWE